MKASILYVELKQGHFGPAWIGYAHFSKTGNTVYFDNKVLGKGKGIRGNYFDIENGDEYWVSGVKKNGQDRHWAGGGKILIDKAVVDDYLRIIDASELPKNKFIITELVNVPNKALSMEIENEVITIKPFNQELMFKNVNDLNDKELQQVIDYLERMDFSELYLKARKDYIKKVEGCLAEQLARSALHVESVL